MEKGLVYLYVFLFLVNFLFTIRVFYLTWTPSVPYRVIRYRWDDEQYAPFVDLYREYTTFGSDDNFDVLWSLAKTYEDRAWVKEDEENAEKFLVNSSETILLHEGFFGSTIMTRDGIKKWHISLDVDYRHYGRQYEMDSPYLGLFFVRISTRLLVDPLLLIPTAMGVVLNYFFGLGQILIIPFSTLSLVYESFITGLWKFVLAMCKFLVVLVIS